MPIVVIGLSHHSAPVAVRERFAFAEARIPSALEELRRGGTADEAVILSTCNRVEIYAATSLEPRRAFSALQDFLLAPQNGSEAENGLLSPALSSRGGEGEKRGPGIYEMASKLIRVHLPTFEFVLVLVLAPHFFNF